MRTVRGLPRRQFRFIRFPAEFLFAFRFLPVIIAIVDFSSLRAAAQANNSAAYTWTTFAGLTGNGFADGVGSSAQFSQAGGIAVDSSDNLYVADTENFVIRKITPAGVVTTIAGFAGISGQIDGTNNAARFESCWSLTLDGAGNIYVADSAVLRKISPSGTNWVVTTIAGSAEISGSADGTNSDAQFSGNEYGIAVDGVGAIYTADTGNGTIRKITPAGANWVVTTIAGSAGNFGSADGTNSDARFLYPSGVAVDSAGNVFITDSGNETVRKITLVGTNWVVTTIAGSVGVGDFGGVDGTNGNAHFDFNGGTYTGASITVGTNGNLYVTDTYNVAIRKIVHMQPNWVVTTWAGSLGLQGSTDATGTNARFVRPGGITIDSLGSLYVTDGNGIRKVNPATVVSTIAGLPNEGNGSADGAGDVARFFSPNAVAIDRTGNVYVADTHNSTIRFITTAGQVSTLAGVAGFPGSADGTGSEAQFGLPGGVAVDAAGNVYVADTYNYTIRKITPYGVVSTVAGLASNPGSVDGTNGNARFNLPQGVAVNANGNIYVCDTANFTIRMISPQGTNWVVTTIAGLAGSPGTTDGTNSDARFGDPSGGSNGNFYGPDGLTVDSDGNIYVADQSNSTIRKISHVGTNWIVTTIAGMAGQHGLDDGINTAARFSLPHGIGADNQGNLYVCDAGNMNIRKMTLRGTDWVVTSIGGHPYSSGSQDGAGSAAQFDYPYGIAADASGNIFVADDANNTIRKGIFTAYTGANPGTFTPPDMSAKLQVTTLPVAASGQWRFAWEQGWHNSGEMEGGLAAGNYAVQFRSLSSYLAVPQTITVPVAAGSLTQFTNQYLPTLTATGTNTGALTVNIGPNSPAGSGWRFLGETPWRPPGSSAMGLVPDTYFIEFEPVNGRVKPSSEAVLVYPGQTTLVSVTYLLSQAPPANVLLPVPVPPGNLSDLTDYPFGFNGQLQSDVGYGSGVAVQTNVVLTAAHLVFNDQTLSYVSQVFWYFQQETGTYQPQPMPARGWYVLSGYAAERTNDLDSGLVGPDQSTPQSRNLDVAALYFLTPVAGGGYGGYLPSDQTPNTWLTGTSLKMLAGYPVDGSLFGDASIVPGELYQTQPQPYPLSVATDQVTNQQEVYVAPWFLSYPGNSGGPLYVQFNGYYYPAGVYLGTLYSGTVPYGSAVRAIDSNVVNLITLAQTQGDNGTNNTGGGVITIIPNQAISGSNPGYVQLHLEPPGAVAAGAAWKLSGDTTYSTATNYTRAVFTTNAVTLEFKPVTGWNLPTNQTVTVAPGQPAVLTAVYTVAGGQMTLEWEPGVGLGITGTLGTVYELDYRTSLTSGSWQPLSTNTITGPGFNLMLPWPPANGPTAFYRAVSMQ